MPVIFSSPAVDNDLAVTDRSTEMPPRTVSEDVSLTVNHPPTFPRTSTEALLAPCLSRLAP